MKRSFYEILGVVHDADQAKIDAAYEAASTKLNATTNVRGTAASVAEMQLLREGYTLLSDPARRVKYDAKLSADAAGIQLMFFPDNAASRRKLGIQTVILVALATALGAIIYFQLTQKMNEVDADYKQSLANKQEAQNRPLTIDTTQPENSSNGPTRDK